ncbi:MAG: cystathionine gamma-synthase [Bacteroidia bacterium]|nr:cystathionine gamma-synthase [Bacteroidia bacterium]
MRYRQFNEKNLMKFASKAVHAGVTPDPSTGAIMTPVFQTSTYVQAAPGDHKGYEYGRTQNPTRDALQTSLAALENGKHALCFASGLAATDVVMKLLRPGDEIICTNDLYGGTYRLFMRVFAEYGLKFHFADLTDPAAITPLVNAQTRMIWIETPTNPLMNIIDIQAITSMVAGRGIITVVDNTFASPYLQNPLDQGADLVVHSITKFINGHSDVIMGCVITSDDTLHERLKFLQNACGAVPGPQDCFLVLRGIKTLHLRMERHCLNGEQVATFLSGHPAVERVYWPGLPSHPNHEIARRQMRGFGGMISFTLKDDRMEQALKVLSGTHMFALAESLGGVESLIGHPASMTHASIPREERLKAGLKDTLIRLSVGIEDAEDLIQDLAQALG